MKRILLLALTALTLAGCTTDTNSETHAHTYSNKFSFDSTYHWHNASCDHKNEAKDKNSHDFNELNECKVCGYVKGVPEEITKVTDKMYSMTLRDDYFETYLNNGGGSSDMDILRFAIENISNDPIFQNMIPQKQPGACSSFVFQNTDGEFCHARNLDFDPSFNSLLIHNIPKSGYESISFSSYFCLNLKGDFSPAEHAEAFKIFEFLPMDGINSAGLALNMNDIYNSHSRVQQNTNKADLTTTALNRLLLNKAGSVEEAISLIQSYDIHDSDTRNNGYHIMISDKSGDACVIEFYNSELQVIRKQKNQEIFAMTNTELNSYFPEEDYKNDTRYKAIMNKFNEYGGKLDKEKGIEVLKSAKLSTTLHSIIYNLERQTVYFCRYQNWDKMNFFGLKQKEINY